jgi:hypothetical protein
MIRKTYTDNNGFLRYEDNCKLVVKREYTKEENTITSELYNTFKQQTKTQNNYSYDELNSIEGKCINDLD